MNAKRDILDKDCATPLYGRVKKDLVRLITSNHFKMGGNFFSLSDIVKKYGVSQITARRVVNELTVDGYLKTSQRKKPLVISSRAKGDALAMARIAVIFYSKSGTASINYEDAPWTSTIFSGMQEKLLERSALWTMVAAETPLDALEKLEKIRLDHDAFICLSASVGEDLLGKFEEMRRPYVIIQPVKESQAYNYVAADYYAGSAEIAMDAIQKDYKFFLYLAGDFNENLEKMRGFTETLLRHGVPPQRIHVRSIGSMSGECAADAFMRFMKEQDGSSILPLAVYSFGDRLSIGALSACRELGLKVPREVGVAGSTGIEEAAQCVPPLTTMQIPMRKMGHAAVDMIFEMLSSETLHLPGVKLKVELVERESI